MLQGRFRITPASSAGRSLCVIHHLVDTGSLHLAKKSSESSFPLPSSGLIGALLLRSKTLPASSVPPHPGSMHRKWLVQLLWIWVLECVFREAGLSWEEASARKGLCPGNSAPPGRAALPGLPAALLDFFVHLMAEFQGHSGSTRFLQPLHSWPYTAQLIPNYTSKFIWPNNLVIHLPIVKGKVRKIVLIILFFLPVLKEARDKLFFLSLLDIPQKISIL